MIDQNSKISSVDDLKNIFIDIGNYVRNGKAHEAILLIDRIPLDSLPDETKAQLVFYRAKLLKMTGQYQQALDILVNQSRNIEILNEIYSCYTIDNNQAGWIQYLIDNSDIFSNPYFHNIVDSSLSEICNNYKVDPNIKKSNYEILSVQDPLMYQELLEMKDSADIELPAALIDKYLLIRNYDGKWAICDTTNADIISDAKGNNDCDIAAIYCNNVNIFIELYSNLLHYKEDWFWLDTYIFIDINIFRAIIKLFDLTGLYNNLIGIKFINKHNILDYEGYNFLNYKYHHLGFDEENLILLEQVVENEGNNVNSYIRQMKQLYASVDPKMIHSKNNNEIKIVFALSKTSYYINHVSIHLSESLRKLGYYTVIIMEDINSGNVDIKRFFKHIIDEQPDILFIVNNFRYNMDWLPDNIIVATWIQDFNDRYMINSNYRNVKSHDIFFYVCSYIIDHITPFLSGNKSYFLPYSGDPETYYPVDIDYKYDVTYVSNIKIDDWLLYYYEHIHEKEYDLISALSRMENDYDRIRLIYTIFVNKIGILEGIRLVFSEREEMAEQFASYCNEIGLLLTPELMEHFKTDYTFKLAVHNVYKINTILFLIKNGIDIHLFGNGWDKIPAFKSFSHPSLNYGDELNLVTNQSKINLNINSSISHCPRSAEIMLSGGFMLTTRKVKDGYDLPGVESLNEIIGDSETLVWCDDEYDLRDKILYYLDNEDERIKIVNKTRHKSLTKITYDSNAMIFAEAINGNRIS